MVQKRRDQYLEHLVSHLCPEAAGSAAPDARDYLKSFEHLSDLIRVASRALAGFSETQKKIRSSCSV